MIFLYNLRKDVKTIGVVNINIKIQKRGMFRGAVRWLGQNTLSVVKSKESILRVDFATRAPQNDYTVGSGIPTAVAKPNVLKFFKDTTSQRGVAHDLVYSKGPGDKLIIVGAITKSKTVVIRDNTTGKKQYYPTKIIKEKELANGTVGSDQHISTQGEIEVEKPEVYFIEKKQETVFVRQSDVTAAIDNMVPAVSDISPETKSWVLAQQFRALKSKL